MRRLLSLVWIIFIVILVWSPTSLAQQTDPNAMYKRIQELHAAGDYSGALVEAKKFEAVAAAMRNRVRSSGNSNGSGPRLAAEKRAAHKPDRIERSNLSFSVWLGADGSRPRRCAASRRIGSMPPEVRC
jgi:hypothetical protein